MSKKLLTLAAVLFALTMFAGTNSYAQTMYFCESVDADGYPVSQSSTFNIGSNGGYLDVLVRLPYQLGSNSVSYVIYRNGEYDNTIYQDAGSDWVWFWKEITFYKSGDYDITAYDSKNNYLASGSLRINMR